MLYQQFILILMLDQKNLYVIIKEDKFKMIIQIILM